MKESSKIIITMVKVNFGRLRITFLCIVFL